MISTYLRMPPLTHIFLVVEIQLVILTLLSILVLGLLVYRNRAAVRIQALKELYANALISEMLSFLETGKGNNAIPKPRFYQFGRREILKTVFLEHFNTVSGPEKAFLAGRYEALRFALDDENATGSFLWWRRLQAISNISLVGSIESAPLLYRMTFDRNTLVSATAYLALSPIKTGLNRPRLVTELPPGLLKQKNLTYEILRNWSVIYGARILINQIRLVRDPALLGILISAASTLQSTEIGDAYAKLLQGQKDLPASAVQDMLLLMRKVGDPAWATTVRSYVHHSDDIVRLRAMEYLVGVGEYDLLSDRRIRRDPSVLIQRWLKSQSDPMDPSSTGAA